MDRLADLSSGRTPLANDGLARALGWVSLGLGAPLAAIPGTVLKVIGMKDARRDCAIARFIGLRELTAAAGLLGWPSPIWLWHRVGGDALDLAALSFSLARHDRRGLPRTAVAAAAVVGVTALDLYAALTRRRKWVVVELRATTTVNKSPREVYDFWRRLDNLPRFMAHLDEVRVTGPRTSHWRATAPFGRTIEWDAEITDDVPAARLGWRSKDGADVDNEGLVRFVSAPGGRGTEVHVRMRYVMPGGKLGATIARYFGEEPHQQLDDDLRRLKEVLEVGEVTRSAGAPGGRRARGQFPQRPAQPSSHERPASRERPPSRERILEGARA